MVGIAIDQWSSALRSHGAEAVDQYEQKLRSFGTNKQKVFEMLSEARAALHFLRNGWAVTMRDKPDLKLEFQGQTVYAEVKHVNEKETDRRDEAAMKTAGELLVPVGNVIDDEGCHGWQQMFQIAKKKEPQYLAGEQNILIFVSYSDALELLVTSAVNEFDDAVRAEGRASPLRKLGGMMLMSTGGSVPVRTRSNVEFVRTRYALHPISCLIASALGYGQLA